MTAREEAIWCAAFATAFVGRKDFYNAVIPPDAGAEDAHHALVMADRAVAAFRSVEELTDGSEARIQAMASGKVGLW